MGERARAATRRFRDDVHARDMLRVYERVLAQAGRLPVAGAVTVARRSEDPAEAARG
jgi:hypothetical protein